MAKLAIASNDKMLQHLAIRSSLASQRAFSISDGMLQKYLSPSLSQLAGWDFTNLLQRQQSLKKLRK